MNKILKVDMHVHTNGVSFCAIKSVEETIDIKISQGYQGMVLTNHIQPWYYKRGEYPALVEKQINEFEKAFKYGQRKNFSVIFGCEVTITNPHYSDWLLYGVNKEFLRNSGILCDYSQKELFELCKKNNILMIQAHPYREGFVVMDLNYLNGIEINCATDRSKENEIIEINKTNHLILTVGTDYHGGGNLLGGLFIPEKFFKTSKIVDYLKKAQNISYFIGQKKGNFAYE